MTIIIATRKSKLAQVQADYVGGLIQENNFNYKKLLVVTEGDKRLDISLNKIGGKGLFTKEVEMALLNQKADCAVHSIKDVPSVLQNDFEIIAIPKREDIRDVFVSNTGAHFSELKAGARIGTSSMRRAAMLKEIRSDIDIVPIRGNIQTRFKKMKENNLDGMVLASAGLKRLNMQDKITDYFDPKVFIPAIGQGALGIEILKTNPNRDLFLKLNNNDTKICVEAEREFMRSLNADCHSVIGAYTRLEGDNFYLIGMYFVNNKIIKKEITGNKQAAKFLANKLSQRIIKES